jgi:hypothetical protein
MKYAFDRPYSDPDAAARKLVEIANSVAFIPKRSPGRFSMS